MKLGTRIAVALLVGWLATAGLPTGADATGGPGGHGGGGGHGSGGHGGFSSGRSSGHSSGSGAGHSIGHSFGRLFGHHGKASGKAGDATPLAGAAFVRGKVVQLPRPRPVSLRERSRFHHHRANDFPFGDRFFLFPPRRGFGFGGCGLFGFPRQRFFLFDNFSNGFDCFEGGFFFDPFFVSGFPGFVIGGTEFEEQQLNGASVDSSGNVAASVEEQPGSAGPNEEESSTHDVPTSNAAPEDKPTTKQVVTLLQLRDGSMYGLTQYWLEGHQLHYLTTYGGRDSIAMDRIDLEKTVQLNADRGVEFAPKPKANPQ